MFKEFHLLLSLQTNTWDLYLYVVAYVSLVPLYSRVISRNLKWGGRGGLPYRQILGGGVNMCTYSCWHPCLKLSVFLVYTFTLKNIERQQMTGSWSHAGTLVSSCLYSQWHPCLYSKWHPCSLAIHSKNISQ